MSIELKQVVEQSLDLSTPTLREMVTRHAAVIDSRATLEDMPEALAFQIDMARALLREFTATQQAETQQPATAIACGIPGMAKTTCPYCEQGFAFEHEQPATGEPVDFPAGAIVNGRTLMERIEAYPFESQGGDLRMCSDWHELRSCFEHLADYVSTHPAHSVPADVVRDAERYEWLRQHQLLAKINYMPTPSGEDLDAAIDDAILAAKVGGKQ